MTQEEKQLLLKDLCGRLPYGVMIQYHTDYDWKPVEMYEISCDTFNGTYSLELCKPYLRSMTSMTEEEKREIYEWLVENDVDWFDFSKLRLDEILISFDSSWSLVNWLNAHHFDFRNLIERGLAIEVTEENNPYASN